LERLELAARPAVAQHAARLAGELWGFVTSGLTVAAHDHATFGAPGSRATKRRRAGASDEEDEGGGGGGGGGEEGDGGWAARGGGEEGQHGARGPGEAVLQDTLARQDGSAGRRNKDRRSGSLDDGGSGDDADSSGVWAAFGEDLAGRHY
jgi:hypothetical protein